MGQIVGAIIGGYFLPVIFNIIQRIITKQDNAKRRILCVVTAILSIVCLTSFITMKDYAAIDLAGIHFCYVVGGILAIGLYVYKKKIKQIILSLVYGWVTNFLVLLIFYPILASTTSNVQKNTALGIYSFIVFIIIATYLVFKGKLPFSK